MVKEICIKPWRNCCGGSSKAPFSISKVFPSISAMQADTSVNNGEFVIIQSNPEEEDNAKLFVKTEEGFNFVVDLSGLRGPEGPEGPEGPKVDLTEVNQRLDSLEEQEDKDTTYTAGEGLKISPNNVISSDVTIPYLDNKLKLTRSKVSKVILSPFVNSKGTSSNGNVTYKLTENLIREDYNSLYIRIFPTGYMLNGKGTTDSSTSVSLEFTVPLFEPTFTLHSKSYSQTTDIEVEAMLICDLGTTNITFTHSKLIVTLGKYSGSPIVLTSPGRHFLGLPNVYSGTINGVKYSLTTNNYPQFAFIGTKFIV